MKRGVYQPKWTDSLSECNGLQLPCTSKHNRFLKKCALAAICLAVIIIWFSGSNVPSGDEPEHYEQHMGPPMGWNSWNYFRCEGLNEDVVKGVAEALVNSGLYSAGYRYVNLDDCWQSDRNASGYIVPDPQKFPSGMKALGDYLHSKDLKFGIYTDVGSLTCEKRPGSLHHEEKDVWSYSQWGVDYIKNDDCWLYPHLSPVAHYARFMKALLEVPRPMIHSIKSSVPVALAPQYGHIRRVGSDVFEEWGAIMYQIDKVVREELWESGRPGFWHDLDMLEVGNGRMSLDENVAHMILWCAFKSPLLLGNDIRSMSTSTLSLLTHPELLAVNQDPLGRSVRPVWQAHPRDGRAGERLVSARCDPSDPRQRWRATGGRLESVAAPGSCVGTREGVEGRILVVVKPCDPTDDMQKWNLDEQNGQIELVGMPGKCLTTNTYIGTAAHVRGCSERQSIPQFRGPNQYWFFYNDAFELVTDDHNGFLIKNSGDACPTVGDHDELQVFSGPLSSRRQVAVLVNRDEKTHDIVLKREHLDGMPKGFPIYLRDAYLRKNLGKLPDQGYTSSLRGHQAHMIVASLKEIKDSF